MRSGTYLCMALLVAAQAQADDREPVLDAFEVRASPFSGHGDGQLVQPASVLRGERLQRRQSTNLGDTVSAEPGVQSSAGGGAGGAMIAFRDGAFSKSNRSSSVLACWSRAVKCGRGWPFSVMKRCSMKASSDV